MDWSCEVSLIFLRHPYITFLTSPIYRFAYFAFLLRRLQKHIVQGILANPVRYVERTLPSAVGVPAKSMGLGLLEVGKAREVVPT
jgi:hypothetical protein